MTIPVYLPEYFELHINNWQLPSYYVGLEGDHLVYTVKPLGPLPAMLPEESERHTPNVIVVAPEEGAWIAFWKKLDALGVWHWVKEYKNNSYNPTPVKWKLNISYGQKIISTSGVGRFPGHYPESDNGEEIFLQLLLALEELLGGQNLRWWRRRSDRITPWHDPVNPIEPVPARAEPVVFSVSIGGFLGPGADLKWTDRRLVGQRYAGTAPVCPPVTRSPSPEVWSAFWAELDQIGFWEWNGEYNNCEVMDGTTWSVAIAHNGRIMIARGSNAYPMTDGIDYSVQFGQFIKSLNRLVGIEDFFE